MNKFRPVFATISVAAVSLVLAACGSRGNSSTPSPASSSASAPASSTTAPSSAASNSGPQVGQKALSPALFANATATADGLKIVDEVPGDGTAAKAGDNVTVDYYGAFTNGKKFDASADHGAPFSFTLGVNQVIKGWDEGVVGMKPGGMRLLYIPYALAYGEQGYGPIPPKSDLIFEVKLESIRQP